MCDWKEKYKSNFSCNGLVIDEGDGEFSVKGRLIGKNNKNIIWWAANPPTYITSFSGSGLPYPNPNIAYENTVNKGMVKTDCNGYFHFRVRYPNSYYTGLGSKLVEPNCHIKLCDSNESHTIKLGNGIPFRMLTYPPLISSHRPRKNPMFYSGRDKLPVRTQEQIIRDSEYPTINEMPVDFWGLKPSHP